jgi:hypothetical protein
VLDIIFNELSLQPFAPDVLVARLWMSVFVQTVRAMKVQAGERVNLRTQYNFHASLLSLDYPVRRWLNDDDVDREERRFIKNLVTKAPFSQDILSAEIQELEGGTGLHEFSYKGEIAIGLGVAYLLDTIPISLTSKLCWDCSYLALDVVHLDEENEQTTIIHASRNEHVQSHSEWFKIQSLKSIHDGMSLWNARDILFPNLQFCSSIGEKLQDIRSGSVVMNPIQKKLFNLQHYAEEWLTGAFDPSKIACRATPESEATLNQYAQERTFICLDGQERVFSWHVRLTPLAWRIHFYPSQPGRIIIGYIGHHLPTVKFK